MPTIVEQIQRDAVDQNIPVSALLRRVKLAASKLGLDSVEQWVSQETNGYTEKVPDYRFLKGLQKAFNPYNGWIPILGPVAEKISRRAVAMSMAAIEDLIARASDEDGTMHMPYPDEISEIVATSTHGVRMTCALHFDRSQLVGIVDRVRNLVLDWAIQLEHAGVSGTEFSFTNDERRRAQETAVTNIIHNSGSIVGPVGSGNVAKDISARDVTVDLARNITRQVRQHEAEIAEAGADASELDERLSALEAAIAAGQRPGVLRGLLADLRNTVSGAAGNLVATGVLATLQPYLGAAGS